MLKARVIFQQYDWTAFLLVCCFYPIDVLSTSPKKDLTLSFGLFSATVLGSLIYLSIYLSIYLRKLVGRSGSVRSKLVLEGSWLTQCRVYSKSSECLTGRCRLVVAHSRWWLPVVPSRFISLMQMVGGRFPLCFLCDQKETIELTDTWAA